MPFILEGMFFTKDQDGDLLVYKVKMIGLAGMSSLVLSIVCGTSMS